MAATSKTAQLRLTKRKGVEMLKSCAFLQLDDHSFSLDIPHLPCPGSSLQGTRCAGLRTVTVPAAVDFAFFSGPFNTPAVGKSLCRQCEPAL